MRINDRVRMCMSSMISRTLAYSLLHRGSEGDLSLL